MEGFGEGIPAYFAGGMIPYLRGGAIFSFSWRGLVEVILLREREDRGVCLGRRTVRVRCCPAHHVGPDIALSLGGPLGGGFLGILYRVGVATSWLARVRVNSTGRPPLHVSGFSGVSFSHGVGTEPSFWDGLTTSLNMDLTWFVNGEGA